MLTRDQPVVPPPGASIIIPTHQRHHLLRRVLEALAQQHAPIQSAWWPHGAAASFEVIVVADGAQPAVAALVREFAQRLPMRLIEQPQAGPAVARNRGVQAAAGALILFLDDDVVPEPAWLAAHLAAHAAAAAPTAVIGAMWSPPDVPLSPWMAWEQAQLADKYERMSSGALTPNPHQFYTGNASVERRALLDVRGFDESLQRSEDLELAYRLAAAGVVFTFAPATAAHHYGERSFEAWLQIPYQYGRNSVRLAKEKGHAMLLETVLQNYGANHWLIRGLIWCCLGRSYLRQPMTLILRQVVRIAHGQRLAKVANLALSALYNLERYQGMADEMGGRRPFLQAIADA